MTEESNTPTETTSGNASQPDNGKTVAIVAHLTWIGWIIALIMNNGNKTKLGSFYVRQMLGILLGALVTGFIPFVNFLAAIVWIVFWIMSIIGASSGEEKLTPGVGKLFQQWFKGL